MTKTQLRKIAKDLSITRYMEYRDWLTAVFEAAKGVDKSYSYAKFSTDLGVGSSNAHSIISGKRALTSKTAGHIINALNLAGADRRYLMALVQHERSSSSADRDAAFGELMRLKTKALPTALSRKQLQFFEHWYHAAILELLRLPNASDDAEWIVRTLNPQPTLPQVKKGLRLLEELGYLALQDGRLRPTDATISTGDEAYGIAIASFHQKMIDLAKQSIGSVPAAAREISAVTLAVNSELRQQIKTEIVALRKRLIALANQAEQIDEIVQVNFQMFCLGRADGDEQ